MTEYQDRISFTDDLTIKFDGENSIDFQQLFGYISGIESAYKASLDAEYHNPEMKLKVVAINQGSFEIILQSAIGLAPDLIKAAPTAITSFKAIMEMIKLKRELKGKKPQSVEADGKTAKVVNTEGNVTYHNCTVINNYFNNPQIDAGLTKAFAALTRGAEPREAISMTSAEETLRIEKETYPSISAAIVSAPQDEDHKQISVIDTELRIGKLDFIGDTMWSFIDPNEKKLSASIEDEKFISSVRTGKIKLSANDVLKVRLRVEVELNGFLDVVKKKNFIEEVYRTIEVPKYEQISINLDGV